MKHFPHYDREGVLSYDGSVVHRMRGGSVWWMSLCGLDLTVSSPRDEGTPLTCLGCIALLPVVETCGTPGCVRGTVCGDGKYRCYRCRRLRS
jgi:hypothetical protein